MEQDFLKIKELLLEYIKLILNNYSNCNTEKILNVINSNSEIVKFNPSNTITFVIRVVYYYCLNLLIKSFHY